MSIWYNKKPFKEIEFVRNRSMMDHLGIEFIDRTDDSFIATMPVNEKTKQPFGIMHGGASAALAETVGSIAANMTLNTQEERAVGLELNISHLKMVKEGRVTATATPIKLGSTIQIWEIYVKNEQGDLVSHSKLTMMILKNRA